MAQHRNPDPSLFWLGLASVLALLGLPIAARAHDGPLYWGGLALFVLSVLLAFRMIIHLQDGAWTDSGGRS